MNKRFNFARAAQARCMWRRTTGTSRSESCHGLLQYCRAYMLRRRNGVWQKSKTSGQIIFAVLYIYAFQYCAQVRREPESKRPAIDINSAITQTVKQLLTVVDAPMLIYKSPVGGRNANILLAEPLRLVCNQT